MMTTQMMITMLKLLGYQLKGTRLFSPKKESAHQKRAREVREAAEMNEIPRKRSRLNSGPNNDASDSAIVLGLATISQQE